MAYGFEARLFLENGPAIHAERAQRARSTRTWRSLDDERRMALVESALREPANDTFPDGLPVAL